MTRTRVSQALLVLAVLAALATIWWDGHRWQSGATAVLLLIVGAACLGNADNHNTKEKKS